MPGAKYNSIKRPKVYEALKRKGYTKMKAAKIANSRDWRTVFDVFQTTREVPREVKAMPAELQRVWTAAFTKALTEKPEDLAGDLAMATIKKLYHQEGDTWVSNKGAGGGVFGGEPQIDPETGEPIEGEIDPETGEPIAEGEGEIDPETGEPVDPLMADPYAEPGEEGEDPNGLIETAEGETGIEPDPDAVDDPNGEIEVEPEEEVDVTMGAESEASAAEELAAMARARAKYRHKYAAKMGAGDSGEFTDTFTLDSKGFRVTSDGYLVANPRVARTGIQLYRGFEVGKPLMDVVRVYRPEKEVFRKAAMTSLAHRPITLGHPDTMVDASNWRQLAVGKSDGDVARDGDFVRVPLVLMDASAISDVQRGVSQLSVGYGATLKWGQGQTPDGQIYDAMQTGIRANHIALVSAARGGDKLRIGDEKRARALARRKSEGTHDSHQQRRTTMAERTLDGVTIELEDRDAQVLDRHLSVLNKKLHDAGVDVEAIKAQIAELQAQLAAAQKGVASKDGEIAVLKQQVDESKLTPELLDKAMNVRMDVVDRATTFFGDSKYAWQAKSDVQIKRDVVAARLGDAKAKAMEDAMIEGAFLTITEPQPTNDFARMTQSFSKAPANPSNYNDAAAAAYDKRNEDLANRFKKNRKPFGATA